ncbi:MAG: TatD family hydrolase [Alistipes sp.]|nr:TatD family hydrolase [Alistipes sp.]
MQLIDTHSHLYDEAFESDLQDALARASDAGVKRLLLPAIDSESHEALFTLCRMAPIVCRPMMGLHPTSINDNPHWREELALVEKYLDNPPTGIRFVAVGEIGLDFYWSQNFVAEQTEAFVAQLRMAAKRDLPVAIHTRAAWELMEELIEREYQAAKARGERLRGVFHAYSEDAATYRRLRKKTEGNFRFGIGGVVTYKKSVVAEAVKAMALEDLILETDCPYLTPVPHRGQRNESAYVVHTAAKVAELQGISPEEVARQTTRNAEELFDLKDIKDN